MAESLSKLSIEKQVMSILKNDGVLSSVNFSEKVRRDQLRFLNQTITKTEWKEYFLKEYSEKDLIVNFFGANRGSYMTFVSTLEDKKTQIDLTLSGSHPTFDDVDDVNRFADEFDGKSSSKEDHQSVISSNEISVGTPQYLIEKHLISSGMINQLSAKGLQGLVFENGGYITMEDAKKELMIIKKFMMSESQKNYSAFKGEDLITQTAMKKIRSELTKKGVDFGHSNMVGLEVKRIIQNEEVWLGNMIAEIVLSKNDPKQTPKVEKKIRTLFKRCLGDMVSVVVEPIAETVVLAGKLGNQDFKDLK